MQRSANPTMLTAGELIWASSRPLIRLVLCVSCGFILTKLKRFPPAASRGIGQILINVALPCLMFSRIVPAFDENKIGALGTLLLVAVLYELMGVTFAWIVKQFFWVPHRFRNGILVAGGWANIGDIPTSVILSVTGSAPFNGTSDQNLAITYMSVFVLVYMVTMFPCGAHRWVARDFVGPDVEPEEVQKAVQSRRSTILLAIPRSLLRLLRWLLGALSREPASEDAEKASDGNARLVVRRQGKYAERCVISTQDITHHDSLFTTPHQTIHDNNPTFLELDRSPFCSPTATIVGFPLSPASTIAAPIDVDNMFTSVAPAQEAQLSTLLPSVASVDKKEESQFSPQKVFVPKNYNGHQSIIIHAVRILIDALLTPQSFSIIASLIIAFAHPLKALFVPVTTDSIWHNTHMHIHPAPDGSPPLAVILDTATFMGSASVPLGLISLGAALARLSIPKSRLSSLPLGAISALAFTKMITMPLIGISLVRGLVKVNLIAERDRVLQFVCMLFACLPTSTIQVYLTQVHSGTGTAEHLSPFLVPQYVLLFLSMTGLVAFVLSDLFVTNIEVAMI